MNRMWNSLLTLIAPIVQGAEREDCFTKADYS